MSMELIINASLPETRIALMESGEIQELLIERASDKGITGNIYKGRVTRVLPGMQAAFVDIGLEKAAFLYVDDVYVHSEIWESEEGESQEESGSASGAESPVSVEGSQSAAGDLSGESVAMADAVEDHLDSSLEPSEEDEAADEFADRAESTLDHHPDDDSELGQHEDDEEDDEESGKDPVGMGPAPGGDGNEGGDSADGGGASDRPEGTVSPGPAGGEGGESSAQSAQGATGDGQGRGDKRGRRGRRGGRNRRGRGRDRDREAPRGPMQARGSAGEGVESVDCAQVSDQYLDQVAGEAIREGERNRPEGGQSQGDGDASNRPEGGASEQGSERIQIRGSQPQGRSRPEFREQRSRDRRIRPKQASRGARGQVNIQDLLKEGQEVIVQVAKDPIATKGARLTCHISLPGRHLVCMPTIDHVGVSRRIERDDERRRLRDFVERNRPKNLGFIVRTASGKSQSSEKRIRQDIEYLTRLWTEIREKAASVTAPALVYEDLNSVLRAIRDWVTEDIDKIIVDSRYHFNDIQRFVSHFMPSLRSKAELYHGDIPIFDAYGISTELSRALERKVWLKSGGYIVIDQAEALVAIDVNTGRYVGKKNLEDTILKTNLEAVQEIAYQLRLRNCGGIIILDLIDMEKEENKQRVYRALEDALKKDRARPTILKISELGLVEMTRKRTRDTIIRTLCDSCSHCEGKGFIKSKQTVAYEVMREIERAGIERDMEKVLVQAHSEVIDILAIEERETIDQLERRYRKSVYLQSVEDFHPEQFEVSGDRKEKPAGEREARSDRQQNQRRDRDRNRDRDRDRDRGRDRNRDRDRDRDRDRESGNGGGSGQIIPRAAQPQILAPAPVIAPQDEDAIGNRNGGQELPRISPRAEDAQPGNPLGSSVGPTSSASGDHDFFDEEDRLAFLRAQAAQDAALASLAASGNAVPGKPSGANRGGFSRHNGGGGQGQGRWDGNGRGGKRRGKRGGRGGNPNSGQGGGRFNGRRDQAVRGPQGVSAKEDDRGNTDPASDGGSGGGNDDRSNPPVV